MRMKIGIGVALFLAVSALALALSAPAATALQDATPTPTAAVEGDMSGMDMSGMTGGLTTDDLAPLAMAFYNGEMVFFIHTEASDAQVAQVLTEMMGPQVLEVASLAEIPAELLGNVYVFTNGIEGEGPLGYQPDVFDSIPGDEAYTPLRAISLVTWGEDASPRELSSAEDILAAHEAGELTIEQPGVVVNMPVLIWPEGHR
jgi:hypothetical protein